MELTEDERKRFEELCKLEKERVAEEVITLERMINVLGQNVKRYLAALGTPYFVQLRNYKTIVGVLVGVDLVPANLYLKTFGREYDEQKGKWVERDKTIRIQQGIIFADGTVSTEVETKV